MSAAAGISTSGGSPNAVVQVQAGMNVQPVVLVDQNGQYVTAPSGVLTTLGDTLYENATPAPARLAGNTTATKNFYTQTGTGSVSAAPAWGTIASGDIPASVALTGTPTAPTGAPGDASTQIATDAFVAAAVNAAVQGLSVKPSVQEATAAALPSNIYANGSSGVGATLTGVSTGVLTVDGIAVALNDRVLVQTEAAPANNGIYKCTLAGAVGVAYILTRATDMNTAAQVPGAFAFVEQGTANAGAGFTVASEGPYTIGTTAITWTQFSGAGEITTGTGLSKSGNTLSLTAPVTIANGGTAQATDPLPAFLASDAGYLAWSNDPWFAGGTATPGAGNIVLTRINVRQQITVATLTMTILVAGSGLSANNQGGLYNSSGTLIGTTADQSTAWQTAGVQAMTLTVVGGQSLTLAPGFYWAAIVQHGTTPPHWQSSVAWNGTQTGAEANPGLTAATARAAYQSGTALANITPASNNLYSSSPWAALS